MKSLLSALPTFQETSGVAAPAFYTKAHRVSDVAIEDAGEWSAAGHAARCKNVCAQLVLVVALAASSPAAALVGNARPASGDALRSTVVIVGSGGNVCSGSMIALTVVLTAAHCIHRGATYRILDSSTSPPRYVAVIEALTHPRFDLRAIEAHRATADVALLRVQQAAPGRSPTPPGLPRLDQGASFLIAGGGVSRSGSDDGVGTVREASLSVTGKPGSLQIRLVDPSGRNDRSGLGACTGDSGGPAFQTQDGKAVIVGVIAWSTGPGSGEGCGGLTGLTPLTLYIDWVRATVRLWGQVP